MRILVFCAYVTVPSTPSLNRNVTGYGVAAWNLARALANAGVKVDIVTQSYFTPKCVIEDVTFLARSPFKIVKSAGFLDWKNAIKSFLHFKGPFTLKLRQFLYRFSLGYTTQLLTKGAYDAIIIHDVTTYTNDVVQFCRKLNLPTIVVIHLLLLGDKTRYIDQVDYSLLDSFFKEADARFPRSIVAVSSGMAASINNLVSFGGKSSVTTINHAIDPHWEKHKNTAIISHINKIIKKILVVGSISKRKNQLNCIKAFLGIPEESRADIELILVGPSTNFEGFGEFCAAAELNRPIKFLGSLSREDMARVYAEAYGVIVASQNEGFGLSVLEGYFFGLPAALANDMDAFNDLFTPEGSIGFDPNDIENFSSAILSLVNREWNNQNISNWAKAKFSESKMANAYIRLIN